MNKITFLISIFFFLQLNSQEDALYQSIIISDDLKENANAVVRYNNILITVEAFDKMIFKNKRIVTVLNEKGNNKLGAYASYDDNTLVKKLEAKVFDIYGEEIKKYKKKDFLDESAVSGGTLYSDSRIKYLNYTPNKYPYTVEFYTEIEFESTAFVPRWHPIEGFYVSTQNSSYKIENESDIEIKLKASNFQSFNINKESEFSYSAKNLKAISREVYSPDFKDYTPYLKAALVDFNMEGVRGKNSNWKEFGKWINDRLLFDTQDIPESVKQDVIDLTKDAETNVEKAKIVYQYMQNKTRYISVQIGIGGWKPMLAEDVERLGYSDCKGLTNFTKALLNAVGVESYYTVLYAGNNIRDIDNNFSATEGNHAILCVPDNDDYIWLECTSQTVPFGYNANFSDDRDVLIITPEGGEIVHTRIYKADQNLLNTKAEVTISENGNIDANVILKSQGSQYDEHEHIQYKSEKEKLLHYKNYWDYNNAVDVTINLLEDNKDEVWFQENLDVSIENYASKVGNRLLIRPNMFNIMDYVPRDYENRLFPVKIDRGFTDIDNYEISIPENYEIEGLFKPVNIDTQFGSYNSSINEENGKLIYKRKLVLNKGDYKNNDYEKFRDFWMEINKNDNAKIVLKNI